MSMGNFRLNSLQFPNDSVGMAVEIMLLSLLLKLKRSLFMDRLGLITLF